MTELKEGKYRKNVNAEGIKGEVDATLELIEGTKDLKTVEFPEENEESVSEALEDTAKDETFVVEKQDKVMPIEQAGEPNPVIPEEMKEFCKDLTEQIPESAKVQGQQTLGMAKTAKLDKPSDE